MKIEIKRLELTNFKCFRHKQITFDSDVTTIRGRNGVGKTLSPMPSSGRCSVRTHKVRPSLTLKRMIRMVRLFLISTTLLQWN